MLRVLMVCMGNICRSPMAESVARAVAEQQGLAAMVQFDSAGTSGHHVGEPPDERARQIALRKGYKLAGLRARKVCPEDFVNFDLILAMDRQNLEFLKRHCPEQEQSKLRLLLEFAEAPGLLEVPDPYYGNLQGFERVLDLCENAAIGLMAEIRRAAGNS